MKILITGGAGFIGFHLIRQLLHEKMSITGLDNLNRYYDVNLKYARLKELGIEKVKIVENQIVKSTKYPNFCFIKLDIENRNDLKIFFQKYPFDIIIHLAAQVGVRYSIQNPAAYIQTNIVGFHNVIELGILSGIQKVIYASSSSVYGRNTTVPFSENSTINTPLSIYAASKRSNELIAYTYSKEKNIHTVGLRFFSVYGAWGRPDMAYFLFTKSILEGNPINLFNSGEMYRDFTYVGDIVEGISAILTNFKKIKSNYSIYNIGAGKPIRLLDFVEVLEFLLEKKAIIKKLPMQNGELVTTFADTSELIQDFDYEPKTTLKEGLQRFLEWYQQFYKI